MHQPSGGLYQTGGGRARPASLGFDIGLVFGPFYGEAQAPAITRTSVSRCTQVTLGP
jgi:hypothetical protein